MKRQIAEQLPLLLTTDRQGQLFLGDEKTSRENMRRYRLSRLLGEMARGLAIRTGGSKPEVKP